MKETQPSKRVPVAAWLWLALGVAVFLGAGLPRSSARPLGQIDFKGVYYGTRCLLAHCDPYNEQELAAFYLAAAGPGQPTNPRIQRVVTLYVNLPTAFPFIVPFALLPLGVARLLWISTTAALFLLACALVFDMARRSAPVAAAALLFLLLSGSEILLEIGNTAGIAVSLCVIGTWCVLRGRFGAVGVLCLAVSLLIKPHDAGPVWLFLLLSGGMLRRRALQSLAAVAVLALPAVLWVSLVAPSWTHEIRANLATINAPGQLNDAGVHTVDLRAHGAVLISLNSLTAVFFEEPGTYSIAVWLVMAPLLALWVFAVLRARPPNGNSLLALAAVAALSLLAVYHRQHDTRLLLLTIPACAQLSAEGGALGQLALLANGAALFFSGDLQLQFVGFLAQPLVDATSGVPAQVLTALLLRPAPVALLFLGVFYLAVFLGRSLRQAPAASAT